jgi:hypothetical protein
VDNTVCYTKALQECTDFSKIQKAAQNSRRQKCDLKQVSYREVTDIRRHGTVASRLATSTSGYIIIVFLNQLISVFFSVAIFVPVIRLYCFFPLLLPECFCFG